MVARRKRGFVFLALGGLVSLIFLFGIVSSVDKGSTSFCSLGENCFLEVGNVVFIGGVDLSIKSISDEMVFLIVDGSSQEGLSSGESLVFWNGNSIKIKNINSSGLVFDLINGDEEGDEESPILISKDETDFCELNEICTLEEGKVVSIGGRDISIKNIFSNKLMLVVDGTTTDYFLSGDVLNLTGDYKLRVTNISFDSSGVSSFSFEFFNGSSNIVKYDVAACSIGDFCVLEIGEIISVENSEVSIDSIFSDRVKLIVNGVLSDYLFLGDYYKISEGKFILIKSFVGSSSFVFEVVDEVLEVTSEKDCEDGCILENSCYFFGYRKSGEYCSDSGNFVAQFGDEESCENNFECGSNLCIDNKCVNHGLFNKILSWFKRIF